MSSSDAGVGSVAFSSQMTGLPGEDHGQTSGGTFPSVHRVGRSSADSFANGGTDEDYVSSGPPGLCGVHCDAGLVCAQDAAHGCGTDLVSFGDLPQAEAAGAIADNGWFVQGQRFAADMSALETRATHAGTDSLHDQRSFQLRDRDNDRHNGLAQRTCGVDLLAVLMKPILR